MHDAPLTVVSVFQQASIHSAEVTTIVRVHAHHLRNKRTRSGASQQNRQAAAQKRQASSSYGRNTGWYEEERWDAGPYQRHYPGWYGGDQ